MTEQAQNPAAWAKDLRLQRLVGQITELNEDACQAELNRLLDEGVEPTELLTCFMEGMRRVGELFETGRYFIAALIMAGEIMRAAMETLSPHLGQRAAGGHGGKIIIGTIQGDIHDLGKNLFSLLLSCHQFEVIDLGVDVSPQAFLQKAIEHKPDLIGISCVLTTSVPSLKEAVELLRDQLPKPAPPVIIGGTCLDERMARFVGSDLWASDAANGLKICQNALRRHAEDD